MVDGIEMSEAGRLRFALRQQARAWNGDPVPAGTMDDFDRSLLALEATLRPSLEDGVGMIAAERTRQIEVEDFTPYHDEQHVDGELSGAAVAYATLARNQIVALYDPGMVHALTTAPPAQLWRWSHEMWKPSDDPIRNLVKAGALIAAEIDRLQREAAQ